MNPVPEREAYVSEVVEATLSDVVTNEVEDVELAFGVQALKMNENIRNRIKLFKHDFILLFRDCLVTHKKIKNI